MSDKIFAPLCGVCLAPLHDGKSCVCAALERVSKVSMDDTLNDLHLPIETCPICTESFYAHGSYQSHICNPRILVAIKIERKRCADIAERCRKELLAIGISYAVAQEIRDRINFDFEGD